MSPPAFHLESVTKTFTSRSGVSIQALKGITLSGNGGEITCLLGPTASGKSTALRILAGMEPPDGGTVNVVGKDPGAMKGRLGYITQSHTLFPWMRVAENISLPLELRGVPAREARKRTDEICRKLGLSGAERLFPYELSGGMQQRTALGRLLCSEATHWLMDEPFSNLDELTQHGLQELLLELVRAHGISVLFVTHSIDEALFLADRLVMLSAGPGRTVDDFRPGLQHPRDRLSPAYGHMMERIRQNMENVLKKGGKA